MIDGPRMNMENNQKILVAMFHLLIFFLLIIFSLALQTIWRVVISLASKYSAKQSFGDFLTLNIFFESSHVFAFS